jgi:hypothetical protein
VCSVLRLSLCLGRVTSFMFKWGGVECVVCMFEGPLVDRLCMSCACVNNVVDNVNRNARIHES